MLSAPKIFWTGFYVMAHSPRTTGQLEDTHIFIWAASQTAWAAG